MGTGAEQTVTAPAAEATLPAVAGSRGAGLSRLNLLRELDTAHGELEQALAILQACGVADAARLALGVIDRLLLHAHRTVLGTDLEMVVTCPQCAVLNALPLGASDVPDYAPRSGWCGPGAGVREPTPADLTGLPDDPDAAGRIVVQRCTAGPADGPRDVAALEWAEQSLCGAVAVACIECGAPIEEFVDVQRLVTSAIAAAVAEADVEVHLLASRYGWDLASIEALPDARRSRLAALAGGGGR
ncbi:hypothetical protein [Mycobacterium sp.]|uniref:hypothetical protein n=1 Tax=Mycobacterium sp. TaxID=1785 RepID=UPI002CFB2746|nr:hypothetical protein [Mycobacterium sp.]HKP43990.1 hypothetical protein [Mycobacterium sp.]